MTTFASPQWRWRGSAEPKRYLCVDNEVRVCPASKPEYSAYIVVPSDFFLYLRTVAEVVENGVAFYLDEMPDGAWLFGFYVKGTDRYIDLWRYTKSTLPPWALKRG